MTPEKYSEQILFRSAKYLLSLSLEEVLEVIPIVELQTLPSMPRLLLGHLELDARLLPVIDFRQIIGESTIRLGLYTPIILLKTSSTPLALAVDEVVKVVRVPENARHPVAAEASFNQMVSEGWSYDDMPVAVLKTSRLLMRQEKALLEELTTRAARRLSNNTKMEVTGG